VALERSRPSRRGNEQGNREWANLATQSGSVAHDGPPAAKATELIITAHAVDRPDIASGGRTRAPGPRKGPPEITVWHDGGSRRVVSGQQFHGDRTRSPTQNLSGPWLCSKAIESTRARLRVTRRARPNPGGDGVGIR